MDDVVWFFFTSPQHSNEIIVTDSIGSWTGDEWEAYARKLLHLRYPGGDFQPVPSDHGGDFGLDGFSRRQCHAYQCYAAVEPLTTKALYEKQRDKIYDDTEKLIKNVDHLKSVLFGTILTRWTLLVPKFNSAPLLRYCGERTKILRAASLDILSTDFQVMVEGRDSFVSEDAALQGLSPHLVHLQAQDPTATELDAFVAEESQFFDNLIRKLRDAIPASFVDPVARELISSHLRAENLLDSLRDYPPLYEGFELVRSRAERRLRLTSALSSDDPKRRLKHSVDNLNDNLTDSLPALSSNDCNDLAYGTITSWLGLCNLELA